MLAAFAARQSRLGLAQNNGSVRSLLAQKHSHVASVAHRVQQARSLSSTPAVKATTTTPPPPRSTFASRLRTLGKYTFYFTASAAVGVVTLTGAIFLHDAFTYTEKVCIALSAVVILV